MGVIEGSGVLADGLAADQRKPEALSEHEPRFLELAAEGSARLEEGLLAEARSELGPVELPYEPRLAEDRGGGALGPTVQPYLEEPRALEREAALPAAFELFLESSRLSERFWRGVGA